MAIIPVYNQTGKKTSETKASDAVFGVKASVPVIHQVVQAILAGRRTAIAHTKTRGEVRGGGKKPWKQKGTGRARHGSTRSPIWVGGGVTFGPRSERNFTLRINKKMKKLAMCMVLSDKLASGKLMAMDALTISTPKTKELSKLIQAWPEKGDLLLVIDAKNENIETAAKNLDNVWVTRPEALSLMDVLKSRRVVVLSGAVSKLESMFGKNAK